MNDHLRAQHEAIVNWGGDFTGELWLLAMPALYPLEEMVLVAAVDPENYTRSAAPRPTGVNFGLLETDDGPVALLRVTLFDRPASPVLLEALLNPCALDVRAMLATLATQDTLQLLFYDRHDGADIGRRVLPVSDEFRATVAVVLSHTAGQTTTPPRWQRAVRLVRERSA